MAVIKAKDEQMAPRVPVPLVRFFFPSPPSVRKMQPRAFPRNTIILLGEFSARRINILSSESQIYLIIIINVHLIRGNLNNL